MPVHWFAVERGFFSFQLWGFLVICGVPGNFLQPFFFLFRFSSVCLSTQRLIALAKGKMLMVKMKMGWQKKREWTKKAKLTLLFKLKVSSITSIGSVTLVTVHKYSSGEM